MYVSLRVGKSWNNYQAPFKRFARFHSNASIQFLKSLWTLWRPQDPISIISENSCLERSSPISHRTLQFTFEQSIDICNSYFSDNFSKDAHKVVWRFVKFGRFRNFQSKYLVWTCVSLSSPYLTCRSICSFCRILFMLSSCDIIKHGKAFIDFSKTSLKKRASP